MPAIEVESLYKVFGKGAKGAVAQLKSGVPRDELAKGVTAAVIDHNWSIEPGETFVVMGLSGSGKSTLIRMLNGLIRPTSGSVRIGGEELSTLSHPSLRRLRREKVSMVFQHFALLPHRTVVENVAFGLEIKGVNKTDRLARAREAVELVGLAGDEDKLPAQLSGGMKQRVGLARALAADTEILLMDEAFSALDPLIRQEMQDQLLDLQGSSARPSCSSPTTSTRPCGSATGSPSATAASSSSGPPRTSSCTRPTSTSPSSPPTSTAPACSPPRRSWSRAGPATPARSRRSSPACP
nr:hypothetical protein GCM10025732_53240 [Glycomyces mayteni]